MFSDFVYAFQGFDEAILGLAVGEKKSFQVGSAAQGETPHRIATVLALLGSKHVLGGILQCGVPKL